MHRQIFSNLPNGWIRWHDPKKFPAAPSRVVKRKGEKDHYNGKLMNLKGAAIGVVRGYQNTPEFDSLMDQNFFNIDEVTDDLSKIRMLIDRRVNCHHRRSDGLFTTV